METITPAAAGSVSLEKSPRAQSRRCNYSPRHCLRKRNCRNLSRNCLLRPDSPLGWERLYNSFNCSSFRRRHPVEFHRSNWGINPVEKERTARALALRPITVSLIYQTSRGWELKATVASSRGENSCCHVRRCFRGDKYTGFSGTRGAI